MPFTCTNPSNLLVHQVRHHVQTSKLTHLAYHFRIQYNDIHCHHLSVLITTHFPFVKLTGNVSVTLPFQKAPVKCSIPKPLLAEHFLIWILLFTSSASSPWLSRHLYLVPKTIPLSIKLKRVHGINYSNRFYIRLFYAVPLYVIIIIANKK